MLGRAALLTRRPVACLFDVAPDRGCRVSPCCAATGLPAARHGDGHAGARNCAPSPQTRLCGPIPRPGAATNCAHLAGRPLAAIPLYGVRTFLDALRRRDCPACLTAAL